MKTRYIIGFALAMIALISLVTFHDLSEAVSKLGPMFLGLGVVLLFTPKH